ncbi:hypothetical protein CPB83DRAFT_858611 [Crepidotus variabilis]|uniref:Uncharacterized protein n=1 Tax=Crepidotus variabilis TaxID=179855 RepID=A0A9P6JMX1_9AGAR|nr:hypothetical protein CPB83DRAFT_858611 [Crepidotus variabilis]
MPVRNIAATRPVNPPGVELVLSEEKLWKGLELKAREPGLFVPGMKSCTVHKDEGNKVSRTIVLEKGGEMTEEVTIYDLTIVYFVSNKGHSVANVVSYNEKDELLLTFSIVGGIPVDPTGGAHLKTPAEWNQAAGKFVQATIDRIRQLEKEGRL